MAVTRNINDDNTLAYLFKKGKDDTAVARAEAKVDIAQLRAELIDLIYPVGSIYMSVNSVSPQTFLGGTWARITGRFLLAATDGGAAGGNSNASIAPGNTGGEASHTLTTTEMPKHRHDMVRQQWYGVDSVYMDSTGAIYNWRSGNGTGGSTSKSYHDNTMNVILETGGNGAHNNMPPYLAVYMWKRTA